MIAPHVKSTHTDGNEKLDAGARQHTDLPSSVPRSVKRWIPFPKTIAASAKSMAPTTMPKQKKPHFRNGVFSLAKVALMPAHSKRECQWWHE